MNVIELTINGRKQGFQQVQTISELLRELNLAGRRLAIEQNGAIVARSRFGDALLRDGDQLEIVVAVGGG